jgi:hypothetical protein
MKYLIGMKADTNYSEKESIRMKGKLIAEEYGCRYHENVTSMGRDSTVVEFFNAIYEDFRKLKS